MEATKQVETGEQALDQDAIIRGCTRFLSGHGRQTARETLTELAAETADDERLDQYGTGAIIEDFEREVADLLGKTSAVLVPSGTMAQQIALRIWSDRNGTRTVVFHPTCHLEMHEEKGYQLLHGLHGHLVGNRYHLIELDDLQQIKGRVAALLLELPQREIGGLLPTWDDLVAQAAWARERGIAVHMDGARLWEAAPYYQRSYVEISALFDTVYVSFYKGVGGLAGAVLAGPDDIIAEARPWIRRHGGNLIRLAPYVISARANLRRRLPRFPAYYERAVSIAAALNEIPGITIKPDPPQTNMAHVYLRGAADALMEAVLRIAQEERVLLFHRVSETEIPGYCMFEMSIGDAANALSDEEIVRYFTRLMTTTSS